MLRGTMDYIDRYTPLSPLFASVMNELKSIDWSAREYGKYDIAGRKAYVMYGRYTHKEKNTTFEAHNKYIDVQYVLEGDEIIGWADRSRLAVQTQYSEENDCQLFDGSGDTLCLSKGDWVVFFPEDAHAPGSKFTCGESVKLIAKIPMTEF